MMPDWRIVRWDENNFDVNICPYSSEAYRQKKWAYVSDVARLYALSIQGGVYLDTDFKLYSSLTPFLDCHGFTGFEAYVGDYEEKALPLLDAEGKPIIEDAVIPSCGLLAGIMGSEPDNAFWTECLDAYMSRNVDSGFVIINNLISGIAVKHGFRYHDGKQVLENLIVYPSEVFACEPCRYNENTVALHCGMSHSWLPQTPIERVERWLDCHGLFRPYRLVKHLIRDCSKILNTHKI